MDDFIFGDAICAGNPRDRRKETAEAENGGEAVAVGEAAGVVDGGVGRLFLEDGEERENDEGQAYVNGCGSQQAVRIHL